MWLWAPLGREIVRVVALAVTLVTLVLAGNCGRSFLPMAKPVRGDERAWLAGRVPVSTSDFSVGLDGLGV